MADRPANLIVERRDGGSWHAIHAVTGWVSRPCARRTDAERVFFRYLETHADEVAEAEAELFADDAEPEPAPAPAPAPKVDPEEPPAADANVSRQIGWVNKAETPDVARERAEFILEREGEDGRKTLIAAMEQVLESTEPEPADDED